tara:strand:+ start:2252 stop:5608 length:3357 start_codon:yes stop_codon:yes gene_type:complete
MLLFLSFGLFFFLIVISLEYFLWLNSTGRLLLLASFVVVTFLLFYQYIITPLFYLFRLKKGMSNKEASVLIGKHFPEVGDKLYNLLDLVDDKNRSELLLASITQRSQGMDPIPFANAINFKDTIKYLKYTLIPILLFAVIWLSGNLSSFFGSYDRVVNYEMAFEQPAPFSFYLSSSNLTLLKGESVTLKVSTHGAYKPENVFIVVEGREMLLEHTDGFYEYTFSSPEESTSFYFLANEVRSKEYTLQVLEVPMLNGFEMELNYPNYTNRKTEIFKGTGNATLPEGTKVTWNIKGNHIDEISLIVEDSLLAFSSGNNAFNLSKKIFQDADYQISTSNANVKNYESLAYKFTVVKDANPTITVQQVLDSLNPNVSYYIGSASDDYKLKGIKLVYYPSDEILKKQMILLDTPNKNVAQFYYTFPSGLAIETGKQYDFYFEAIDNDAIHRGKSTKSQLFSTMVLDDNQLKNKELEQQQKLLDSFDKSIDRFKLQEEKLAEINTKQKEKRSLNYNEQNEIKDFLRKQQNQEQLMEKFSKELMENLKKSDGEDKQNKLLQERLQRQELEARKNQKLLQELNIIADKINKEELSKRLEELAKGQKNSERNLEQLLELTKKYYVTEKMAQLSIDLKKIAKEQQALSQSKLGVDFIQKEQDKLNEEFENIVKDLNELQKDNAKLKKPLEIKEDKPQQESISKDQQEASEEITNQLEKGQNQNSVTKPESDEKISKKQKSAADKMKQMSDQIRQSASSGGSSESISEDAEMLRQILDNLITFSFKQENLYNELEFRETDLSQFAGTIKRQKELRGMFEHVDDSLFALSLRRVELSEFVNEQITEVYYNMDKSLENIAENRMYQGVSNQKYVLNASNSLSDFLANLLDNLNQNMQSGEGKGQGKGQGFQLPDIIQSQAELQKKMSEEGKQPKGNKGQNLGEGKEGENGKQGNSGKEGGGEEGSKEGQFGKNKSNGVDGSGNLQGNGQPSEEELKEIYEIYKQQQTIRQQLEQQLKDMISNTDKDLAKKLLQQMEDFENDLLESGITERTKEKANTIQHQLLRLENASIKQGEKNERESNTNIERFKNPIITKPKALENYHNEIEILNRQALPLHQVFQSKVQRYFKVND